MQTDTQSPIRDEFAEAIHAGSAEDLLESTRGGDEDIASSEVPRGLALKSLRVGRGWERLRNFLGRKDEVYFLSVAFDISDKPAVILPPKEVPAEAVYKVQPGETIEFTLGDGAPLFPPRPITGGLIAYVTVCEADHGLRHVGEVVAKVHEDLAKDDSLTAVIAGFIKNPAKTIVDEGLTAFTAALQPVATVLKNNGDDYVALFSGIYPATGPWTGLLEAERNGAKIVLKELPVKLPA